jgi:predicted O-methyltransferase YrrM
MNQEYYQHLLNKVKYGPEDSDRHVLSVFALAMSIGAKNILELGVRTGNTTLPFLLAAKENGGMVHSVDLDMTTFQCPNELKIYWKFMQSDSIAWLDNRAAEGGKYDIIYIDDWHSYPHVKRELELIEPMIGPSGLVLLHDLMYSNAQPHYRSDPTTTDAQWEGGGPYRAVAELDLTKWEYVTIPINHGLTILRKKSGQILT